MLRKRFADYIKHEMTNSVTDYIVPVLMILFWLLVAVMGSAVVFGILAAIWTVSPPLIFVAVGLGVMLIRFIYLVVKDARSERFF